MQDPNIKDKLGYPALAWAVSYLETDQDLGINLDTNTRESTSHLIIKKLLDAGAKANLQDAQKIQPLTMPEMT